MSNVASKAIGSKGPGSTENRLRTVSSELARARLLVQEMYAVGTLGIANYANVFGHDGQDGETDAGRDQKKLEALFLDLVLTLRLADECAKDVRDELTPDVAEAAE